METREPFRLIVRNGGGAAVRSTPVVLRCVYNYKKMIINNTGIFTNLGAMQSLGASVRRLRIAKLTAVSAGAIGRSPNEKELAPSDSDMPWRERRFDGLCALTLAKLFDCWRSA